MNLDELQSVQARERQSSDLQHLRSSFYREVGAFIQELSDERARAVDRADDPFSSPEVRQLTDDIETAEQTVEAIYERRVGKVVKKASIAAADMPVDDEGLTREEEALFEDLVGRIEGNRETVLSVLDGDAPAVSCSVADGPSDGSTPDPAGVGGDSRTTPSSATDEDPGGVSAADLMGGDTDDPSGSDEDSTPDGTEPESADRPSGGGEPDAPPAPSSEGPVAANAADDSGNPDASPTDAVREEEGDSATGEVEADRPAPTAEERDVPGIPRTTVRITADVGEVVGADDRDYDLGPEDVVTLPEPNAEVLVEKDAAERLE